MSNKMLWQFYITFWSVFIVSFLVIYGCDISFLKNITLSSVSSATLSVINIFFQNKDKMKKRGSFVVMDKIEVLKGLHDILLDYSSDVYYRDIIVNAIDLIEREDKHVNR